MKVLLALVVGAALAGPRSESARLEADAVALLAKGRNAAALEKLDAAVRLDPTNAGALANRCTARYKLADYDGALADYEKTKKLAPKLARALAVSASDAHYRRALKLVDAGKGQEAAGELYAAVRLDRRNALAYAELGYLALAGGDAKNALGYLDRALSLSPGLSQARANRAAARWKLGRNADALADIDAALLAEPENQEYRATRARILESAK